MEFWGSFRFRRYLYVLVKKGFEFFELSRRRIIRGFFFWRWWVLDVEVRVYFFFVFFRFADNW